MPCEMEARCESRLCGNQREKPRRDAQVSPMWGPSPGCDHLLPSPASIPRPAAPGQPQQMHRGRGRAGEMHSPWPAVRASQGLQCSGLAAFPPVFHLPCLRVRWDVPFRHHRLRSARGLLRTAQGWHRAGAQKHGESRGVLRPSAEAAGDLPARSSRQPGAQLRRLCAGLEARLNSAPRPLAQDVLSRGLRSAPSTPTPPAPAPSPSTGSVRAKGRLRGLPGRLIWC